MSRLSGPALRFQIGEVTPAIPRRVPCWKKDRFVTLVSARHRVATLIAAGMHRPELGLLRPYGCPHCGHFHVGHKGKHHAD